MSGSQISTSVSIISSLLGYQAISLSNMDSSAATVITAGSKVEIASAFFTFSGDETPNATSWTAITTGETAYIRLTPAGAAGSQTVTADWSSTAPEWSDSKQGWYLTAGSNVRYVAGCYKNSATLYDGKFILDNKEAWDITYERSALKFISATSITGGSAFSALEPAVPYIGAYALVSGGIRSVGGTVLSVIQHAHRDNANTITLPCASYGANVTAYTLEQSSATAIDYVRLSWYLPQ